MLLPTVEVEVELKAQSERLQLIAWGNVLKKERA
jgi:hypothetical protein